MELIMTPRIKRSKYRDVSLPPSWLSTIKVRIREWQIDLAFLKDKFALLQMLITMGGLWGKRVIDKGESIQKELYQMENNTIPSFEEKLKEYREQLKQLDNLPQTFSESSSLNFRKLQAEWRELCQNFKNLELRVLEALIEGYPILIY